MGGFGIPETGTPNWTPIPDLSGQWDAANIAGTNKIRDVWAETTDGHKYDVHQTPKGVEFFVDGKPFDKTSPAEQQAALKTMNTVYSAPDFKGPPAFQLPRLPSAAQTPIPPGPSSSRSAGMMMLRNMRQGITSRSVECAPLRSDGGNPRAAEKINAAIKRSPACHLPSPG